ncbi:MAG: PilC/PilY family type IV pilus protein [Pseudomonadota bacterium]|nr:PilC/PilY family type IV pilus protein [Pseudomonadota bacterium]
MNCNLLEQTNQTSGGSCSFLAPRVMRRFRAGKWRFALLALFALMPVLSVQGAVDDVDVDQSPLIVSDPLPPNIVLLYDDSGSMGRGYLPDAASGPDGFRDSSRNRQYYNPGTLYTIPPRADGTTYPAPTFPNGYDDPFRLPNINNILLDPDYSDDYVDPSYTNKSDCQSAGGSWREGSWRRSPECHMEAFVYFDGGDKHHVIVDGASCGGLNHCHHASDSLALVGGTTTTTYGQNVAHWYSYYRKRDLSAKSGIFGAFSSISSSFRVGFGSINSNGKDYIQTNVNSDRRFTKGDALLAGVERFGEPGEAGAQRERFWGWLASIRSVHGTPLRKTLKAVGDYFGTEDHPWESGYDDGATYSAEKYSCRPSFAILVSDGTWNGGSPSVGNTDASEPKPFEGSGQSDYLADVAFKYWSADLRTDLANDVPVTDRDGANWQHMSTFTVGLGVEPSLSNDGGGSMADIFSWARTGNAGAIDTTSFQWGTDKVADMAHAGINGRGDFFSARDPEQFAAGIKQALAAIAAVPGAGSSPFFSGGEKLTSNTRQYTAGYTTGAWTGELTSAGYDGTAGTFSLDPWKASAHLPAAADRNIWTMDQSGNVVEFKKANLGDYWQTLGDNLYLSDPKGETWGQHIVNYLRGDQSYEDPTLTPLNDVLRKRDSLLGDIVNSTPVVIAEPKADLYKHVLDETYFDGLSGSNTYEQFATGNASRTPIVYVAANDGMLHAFNANTGVEVFAFIPGAVVGGTGDASLARLANPEYGVYNPVDGTQPVPHQYFNDGKLTTQNVYLNGEWKTILVGTTGRGTSRTVYALDITNPADLADPAKAGDAILWERSAGDGKSNDEWIGMALGRPTISLIKDSNNNAGQWVAHLGNGPNSQQNRAALLQFDLATGDLKVYPAGAMADNGLAAPYVIQKDDNDGLSEYAFAGDLQGNVWRFDLSPTGGSVSAPIYVAKEDGGARQPITTDMLATQNEKTGAIWVFFGTGRFLTDSDIRSGAPQVQTWYGLRALTGGSGLSEVNSSHTRTDLQKREILAENAVGSGVYRATSAGEFSDLTSDNNVGWYMDLVSPDRGEEGERIVYQTQLIAGRLIVNTLVPKSSGPCDTFPGGATLIVDPFSGANPGEAVLDANDDDKTDNNDGIIIDGERHYYNGQRYGVGMAGSMSALIGDGGTALLFGLGLDSSQMGLETTMGTTDAQRLNWHEIFN